MLRFVSLGAVLAALSLAGCDGSNSSGSADSSAASTSPQAPSQESVAKQRAPADERAFVSAVERGRAAYQSASNDMMKVGTRGQRKAAICAAISGPNVENWTGVISDLGANSEGKGILKVSLANGIEVATFNNGLSDGLKDSRTLIESSSPLFAAVASLKKGDAVRFSGTMFPDETDCVDELSAFSLSSSMTEPSFLMRFETVQKL